MEAAVQANRSRTAYRDGFAVLPVVGTDQSTLQSASLDEGGLLVCSRQMPLGVDPLLDWGDGTVPRLSATPIELSNAYPQHSFVIERHDSLQRPAVLAAH